MLEVASRLASLPQVVAGSVTSYAGGAIGHDPIRVSTATRARGLTPNIHVTCVSQDRRGLRKTLEDLHALGLENVFALTGDYPDAPPTPARAAPVFDLDSVQLVRLIAELRAAGMPFHVAVAVSPFKYVEADCVYQYLKLEKKIAAGADLAITQVGWDAEKFRELRRYLDERGLRHAGPGERLRPDPTGRRADGDRPASGLLGVAGAPRGRTGRAGGARPRAPGAARASGPHRGRPAGARLRRRLPRRDPRRRPGGLDHPPGRGAVRRSGSGSPTSSASATPGASTSTRDRPLDERPSWRRRRGHRPAATGCPACSTSRAGSSR